MKAKHTYIKLIAATTMAGVLIAPIIVILLFYFNNKDHQSEATALGFLIVGVSAFWGAIGGLIVGILISFVTFSHRRLNKTN